jgi:hypothetical protein
MSQLKLAKRSVAWLFLGIRTLRIPLGGKGIFFGESSFASAKDIRKVKQTDCLSRFAFSFLLFLLVFEKYKN